MAVRVAAEEENPCNLQININDEQTFFLNQRILCAFSGRLRKMMKKSRQNYSGIVRQIEIQEFPGGPAGFELVSRFCYGNGSIKLTASNVSLLHCGAIFLGMTEKASPCNLMQQTDAFLQGMFYWSWNDVLVCLRSCETFYSYADICGLIDKLVSSLLAKIAQNTDITSLLGSSSSSATNSDPDSPPPNSPQHHYNFSSSASCMLRLSCSAKNNTDFVATNTKPSAGWSPPSKAWWFDDLATLSPRVIEKVIRSLGSYGADNNSLLLTKFLLHYLKAESALQSQCAHNSMNSYPKSDYSGLADTVAYGVLFLGKTARSSSSPTRSTVTDYKTAPFSCRSLFSIMRLVSGFGLSKECRAGLRKLIGGMLDQAKLDDLLVSGAMSATTHHDHVHHHHGACSGNDGRDGCERAGSDSCVYDVNLVLRLIRVFVSKINNAYKEDRPMLSNSQLQRLKMVGWLIDQYLGEISPDQNLSTSKFMAVANSLPDSARDCFDGVYRAIDIYLQSHPNLSMEERSRLCGCLNYEKLSLEACKDLAKNPRIPPRVAVQALASQQANLPHDESEDVSVESVTGNSYNGRRSRKGIKQQQQQQIVLYDCSYKQSGGGDYHQYEVKYGNDEEEEDDDVGVDVQRMRWRVVELEKLCWEMKGQMSKLVGHRSIGGLPHDQGRGSPRFC